LTPRSADIASPSLSMSEPSFATAGQCTTRSPRDPASLVERVADPTSLNALGYTLADQMWSYRGAENAHRRAVGCHDDICGARSLGGCASGGAISKALSETLSARTYIQQLTTPRSRLMGRGYLGGGDHSQRPAKVWAAAVALSPIRKVEGDVGGSTDAREGLALGVFPGAWIVRWPWLRLPQSSSTTQPNPRCVAVRGRARPALQAANHFSTQAESRFCRQAKDGFTASLR